MLLLIKYYTLFLHWILLINTKVIDEMSIPQRDERYKEANGLLLNTAGMIIAKVNLNYATIPPIPHRGDMSTSINDCDTTVMGRWISVLPVSTILSYSNRWMNSSVIK